MTRSVEGRLGPEHLRDYLRSYRAPSSGGELARHLLAPIGGGLGAYLLLGLLGQSAPAGALFLAAFLCWLLMAGFGLLVDWRQRRAWAASAAAALAATRIELTEAAVIATGATQTTRQEWAGVRALAVAPRTLIFHLGGWSGLLAPRSGFPDPAAERDFIDYARARIAACRSENGA